MHFKFHNPVVLSYWKYIQIWNEFLDLKLHYEMGNPKYNFGSKNALWIAQFKIYTN